MVELLISFFEAVLDYHMNHLPYYISFSGVIVVLAILMRIIRMHSIRKHGVQKLKGYVFLDMTLLLMSMICGTVLAKVMSHAALPDCTCLIIVAVGAVICMMLITGASFLRMTMYLIPQLVTIVLILVYLLMLEGSPDVVYLICRLGTLVGFAGLLSDSTVSVERTDHNAHEAWLHSHTIQSVSGGIAVLLLFIMPSDLYYVNQSGYAYGDEVRIILEQFHNEGEEKAPQPADEPAMPWITLEKNALLTEKKKYTYEFNTDVLDSYDRDILDSHGIAMLFVNDRDYQNAVMQEIKTLMGDLKINPSYLFSGILNYGTPNSDTVILTAQTGHDPIAAPEYVPGDMDGYQFAEAVFHAILKEVSFLPENPGTLKIEEQDGVYYVYFTVCDETFMQSITLYLHLDEELGFTGVDYSVLQFVDMDAAGSSVSCPDYAAELDAVFNAMFSGTMERSYTGGDMLLYKDESMVYYRKNNCVYS